MLWSARGISYWCFSATTGKGCVKRELCFLYLGIGIVGMTCLVSDVEPGLVPQGALLHPMVCTQELERSKPCKPRVHQKGHGQMQASQGTVKGQKVTGQ